jgi:hypothetical protein
MFPGNISTARGPEHCSIIRKFHLCACAKLSSRSLGKIVAEIAVLYWKHFYRHGITALFRNQETASLLMLRLSSRSLGKIGAETAVLTWNYFYYQGSTALLHNQENAPLRMRQIEFSLSWQVKC